MPMFLYPKPLSATQADAALYHGLVQTLLSFGSNAATLAALLAFALLYVQALMLTYLMNEFRMLAKPTYLPGAGYLLITTLLPEWSFLSSPLVATTFILWTLIKLFRLYNVQVARSLLFNSGLLLGISSYIYFPAASFLLCFVLGMLILRPFRLNELVLFLLGCLTPYYFYGAYLFLADKWNLAAFVPQLLVRVPDVRSNLWLAVSTLFLTVPFLLGGFYVQSHLHKMLIQVRKNWSIVLLYLILAFFVPFVNSNASFSNWVLLAAPFACFHAATYFYLPKLWMANVLFFLTLGYVIYLEYGTVWWQ